ncbi:MAG: sodium:solute symporter [Flavobacteriaceae bacterium]|nr:sodium:solute symporter [Flavobacteriaceae bacterium]
MSTIDWMILIGTLLFIIGYGYWKTRGAQSVEDYVLAGNNTPWWTIGLSVMATQASAITFLSTPGQAFHDGMGFVQFYFGLPLAMIVICVVFIPLYYKLKVRTAYEFLENRFGVQTRTLTALLFLVQRGLAAGITIFAPAIILSAILGWPLRILVIIIGISVMIYTVSGGTKAVNVTQKQQMFIMFSGMTLAFFYILKSFPSELNFNNALSLAAVHDKLNILDFSFDTSSRYTIWSGLTGGFFLALSYFGTDQSQVQRYLTGKSIRESRLGLIFNGLLKVPMQFFILLTGVMVFVFYQINPSPIHFNPLTKERLIESNYRENFKALEGKYQNLEKDKKKAQLNYIEALNSEDESQINSTKKVLKSIDSDEKYYRKAAKELLEKAAPELESNDKDYVFIHYILNNLPIGLIGLLLAVIMSAAMSSSASELNALGTITAIDLYQRHHKKKENAEHYLKVSKLFTLAWGLIAIGIASIANLFDNLIQLVNIIGSIFYGNILGIFLIAFFIKLIQGKAVFKAAIITQIVVLLVYYLDWMSYLWLNLLGCILVVLISFVIQKVTIKTSA